jgi:ABC-type uncharacterized transport system ATPase subunit
MLEKLNLNLYKNEILGYNGAGKSITIHILCGLYEADLSAHYENENIYLSILMNLEKR